MVFKNPYLSPKARIGLLQRWLIIHSILYYEMDTSIVTDKQFDANARQLVQMQKEHPEETKQSDYFYVFYDFDGSTGFDLYYRLKPKDKIYLKQIAMHVLKLHSGGLNERKKR